jgi:uncharacterized protein YraI
MIVKKIIKITIPICVVLVVAISVAAALLTKEESILANEETAVYAETETITANSADNPLIADTIPEVNALVETYLTALANGDEETYGSITNNMTDITRIRVAELGKYIEGFPAYNVFTKFGPLEGSYVVFVAVRAQLANLEAEMPGIYNLYICTDENGNLYINEDTVTEEEQEYIAAVNADASVVGLQESFNEEYKNLLDSNETVRTYIELMNNEIRGAVGAALASVSAENAAETQSLENVNEDPTILHKDCEAVATETINVRSSDSETADKVGKLAKGTAVHIIEMRVNGWTKITYEGKEAYVKNDYLEVQLPPEEAGTGGNVANGKVIATTKVNVRAQASASASRLGQVDAGTTLDWIADVDGGFSKVIFEGKVGYIATEFLTKQ